MKYTQLTISFSTWDESLVEILVAELAETGYEGFFEGEKILNAYIPKDDFDESLINSVLANPVYEVAGPSFTIEILPDKNWNEEWEKDYEPVLVDDVCLIKTEFHKIPDAKYNIIIEPKMSFGTGHHETTRLMIRQILQTETEGKVVLDMGCGTGVLGIFSLMRKAAFVTAIDNDEWACTNSQENFSRNINDLVYEIICGNAGSIPDKKYDVILANINRNILLEDMQVYINHLQYDGLLILSGILETDRKVIMDKAISFGLIFVTELFENKWISVKFRSLK
jgi:ribosomal protein L11 methyltransferase